MQQEAPATRETSNVLLGCELRSNCILVGAVVFLKNILKYKHEKPLFCIRKKMTKIYDLTPDSADGIHFRYLKDGQQCDFQ